MTLRSYQIYFLLLVGFCACTTKVQKEVESKAIAALPEQKPVFEFGFNTSNFVVHSDTIRTGDSFGKILFANHIDYSTIARTAETIKDTFDVRRLVIGKPYTLLKSKDTLEKAEIFVYKHDLVNYTVIDMRDSIAKAYNEKHPIRKVSREVYGRINTTLSDAVLEQGMSYNMVDNISSIYAWTIDFFRLQKGDSFKVIYTDYYVRDSIYAGSEPIVAAMFKHANNDFYAFRYEADTVTRGKSYYDDEARLIQRPFLKAPLKFSRISSRYSGRRFHPVLKRWKAHRGTDYAAPRGTPIMATASGVITKSGYTRGNGKFVKVRHNRVYETQYLHMSRRAVKVGQYVNQGDVIGYVGSTGLATGPHVCYRFWKDGRQIDPLRHKMPAGKPIDSTRKKSYHKHIKPLKEQLDCIREETQFFTQSNNSA